MVFFWKGIRLQVCSCFSKICQGICRVDASSQKTVKSHHNPGGFEEVAVPLGDSFAKSAHHTQSRLQWSNDSHRRLVFGFLPMTTEGGRTVCFLLCDPVGQKFRAKTRCKIASPKLKIQKLELQGISVEGLARIHKKSSYHYTWFQSMTDKKVYRYQNCAFRSTWKLPGMQFVPARLRLCSPPAGRKKCPFLLIRNRVKWILMSLNED